MVLFTGFTFYFFRIYFVTSASFITYLSFRLLLIQSYRAYLLYKRVKNELSVYLSVIILYIIESDLYFCL